MTPELESFIADQVEQGRYRTASEAVRAAVRLLQAEQEATPAERENWRPAGGGFGIHWPDLDEDLSTDGLLRGAPAPGGRSSTAP